MSVYRFTSLLICWLLSALCGVMPTFAHSGHTSWGSWDFDWKVKDNAGIGIHNVSYKNERVFYKANLPVIRVRYKNNVCGPYADRINWDNLVSISNCGGKKVCQKSFSAGGRQWLEVGVLARIGKYSIYQVWYFSEDGYLRAKVWSKGLHCNEDHDHHAYWQMDFDLDGPSNDQVFVYNKGAPNEGWGPGWHKYTQELNTTKNPASERVWFVRDNANGHGIWVLPGPDGTVDWFSTKDVAPRRYHLSESGEWPFGAWGHLGYLDGENIQEKDVVFWYVGHLYHDASEGEDHWHWTGPLLKVDR